MSCKSGQFTEQPSPLVPSTQSYTVEKINLVEPFMKIFGNEAQRAKIKLLELLAYHLVSGQPYVSKLTWLQVSHSFIHSFTHSFCELRLLSICRALGGEERKLVIHRPCFQRVHILWEKSASHMSYNKGRKIQY